MRHRRSLLFLACLPLLGLALPALAQDAPHHAPPEKPAAAAPALLSLPADSVTHHQLKLADKELAYTATAGTLPLSDEHGEETAEIFYVSFTLDGAAEAAHRPITYVFNGGPGAASAYLDIGALGPRVLDFGVGGTLPPRS